jgi:replicative DNA helicase
MKPSLSMQLEKLLKEQIQDETLLSLQLKQMLQQFENINQDPLPTPKSWLKTMQDLVTHREQHWDVPEVFYSGWAQLDQLVKGFRRGDLVIIGGRPAMGKTAVMATLAYQLDAVHTELKFETVVPAVDLLKVSLGMVPVAQQDKRIPAPSLYCGTQCTETNFCFLLYYLLVSHHVPAQALNDLHFLKQMEAEMSKVLKDRQLDFVQPISFDINTLIQMFEAQLEQHPYQAIFIESIQDIKPDAYIKYRDKQLEHICRCLKAFAEKHRICVFVGSQLSRATEFRAGEKRPQLSDLRDSGALEEIADKVIMIYRNEYYGFTEDAEGRPTEGVMDLMVLKNNSGATGTVSVKRVQGKGIYADYHPEEDYITLPKRRLTEIDDLFEDLF